MLLNKKLNAKRVPTAPSIPPSSILEDDSDDFPEGMEEFEDDCPPLFRDNFEIISDAFDSSVVVRAELPKMAFKTHSNKEQSNKEKTTLMIGLKNTAETIKNGLHKKLFQAAKRDRIQLDINWLSQDGTKKISVWKFDYAKIFSIDFGYIAEIRPEENFIILEIEYNSLTIDGITI